MKTRISTYNDTSRIGKEKNHTLRLSHKHSVKNNVVLRLSHHNTEILSFPMPSNEEIEEEEAFKIFVKNFRKNYLYRCNKVKPEEFIHNFIYRHPEIFWLSNSYRLSIYGVGQTRRIDPIYAYSCDESRHLQQIIYQEIRIITSGAMAFQTPFDRLKYIYEWFCENIKYCDNNTPEIYTVVGALRDHRAVCAGIAKAFMLACLKVNIPCGLVSGNTGLSQELKHCWNAVRIDGAIYHIDVTSGINCFDQMKIIGYPIFLVPESELHLVRYIATPTLMKESKKYKYTNAVKQCFSNEDSLKQWLKRVTEPGVFTISGDVNAWSNNAQYQECVKKNASLIYTRGRVMFNSYAHFTTVVKFL